MVGNQNNADWVEVQCGRGLRAERLHLRIVRIFCQFLQIAPIIRIFPIVSNNSHCFTQLTQFIFMHSTCIFMHA